ncbi:Probable LRR receptor-like serine/threonine-protein kinase At3g47570 [Linum grandiflorum]
MASGSNNLSAFRVAAAAILQLCLISCPVPSSGRLIRSNETDRLALLEFKSMISDPLGLLSSWNDSTRLCNWRGVYVTTKGETERVQTLYMPSFQLSGSIAPHIGNLSFLTRIDLSDNSFSGEIPAEIGRLRRLEKLVLSNNSFSGEIPSGISACSNLEKFIVPNNDLAGGLPLQMSSLQKLQHFDVSLNNLSGTIPPSYGNLSSLLKFIAGNNSLTGTVPESLGRLGNLLTLTLEGNNLSGEIPAAIFNISSLKELFLGMNRFHGSLPMDLAITLPNIQSLNLNTNRFTGRVPSSLSNASNLVQLQLSANRFTGSMPSMASSHNLRRFSINQNFLGTGNANDLSFISSLTNATSLEILTIDNNRFGGSFPEEIGRLSTNLTRLDVSRNKISGSIPTGIQNLVSLQFFSASRNDLSGNIPSVMGNMLTDLDLSENGFSGNVPSSIGNLTRLNKLHLNNNRLGGEIPASIENCKRLILLDLSHNNFSGLLPPQVMGLTSLSILLNLSHNQLTGPLPPEMGKLTNLGVLDLSQNMLSGSIPSSIGSCVKLEAVYLQDNLLQGDIPSSLGSLRGIQKLDISANNLSGQIPKSFEGMSILQMLNLSYNNFEGEMPKEGVLKNCSVILVAGNSKLCGGMAELKLRSCSSRHRNKTFSHMWKIVVSTISGVLFLACIGCCLLIFWMRKREKKDRVEKNDLETQQLSYQSLYKATDGFSTANLIGMGSFGSVFKGVLDMNGTVIAVKVFNLQRRGSSKSFIAECKALKNIRHRNLVQTTSDVPTKRTMKFLQRLDVAIEIASAVDYLHHQSGTPTVHCDLKPSNVLLDKDMVAHVSDFGLARILPSLVSNPSSDNQTSSVGIKGTVGYAPPEYGMGNGISIQGDVYSYGVMLLEMFTGKRPTDESFKEGSNLRSFIRSALSEHLVAEVVDPVLRNELLLGETAIYCSSEETDSNKCKGQIPEEVLTSILKIGVLCSSDSPQDRISITEVAARLVSLRKLLSH